MEEEKSKGETKNRMKGDSKKKGRIRRMKRWCRKRTKGRRGLKVKRG
jgi:hypothetical protein